MTASIESTHAESQGRSRRALLAGALGGIGAWAASAIGRPSPARAEGEPVVVGGEHLLATSPTIIANYTNTETVLWGDSSTGVGVRGGSGSQVGVSGTSTSGFGVHGTSSSNVGVRGFSTSHAGVAGSSSSSIGVQGSSSSSIGVQGDSSSSIGVQGSSSSNIGVRGFSTATNQPANQGWSNGSSSGVQGSSGSGSPPAAKAKTGVFGYAAQDSNSKGVWGESPAGQGIVGSTTTGYAGYFIGKVYSTQFYELSEAVTPAAPVANRARLFIRDNGAGKTQLCVRFATGSVRVLTTEP